MGEEEVTRLLQITKRRLNELLDELLGELQPAENNGAAPDTAAPAVTAKTMTRPPGHDLAWAYGDLSLWGDWDHVETQHDQTYTWPDGRVETYRTYVIYRGTGGYDGLALALGYPSRLTRSDVVGFVVGYGGSKRAITRFQPLDDFPKSNKLIALIRGGGKTGRGTFRRGEPLPEPYAAFETAVLADVVAGKWNVQGVLADADDDTTMLAHTALQAKLRRIA
jgi:hypothetical protein